MDTRLGSSTLLPKERLVRIHDIVQKEGAARVAELAALFGTSAMTIRRDLTELEAKGLVVRTQGGVMARDGILRDYDVDVRQTHNVEKKSAIAQEAMRFIQPGDYVALDASTTVVELAKYIANLRDVTVVTNNFMVANILASSPVELVFAGGYLRREAFSTVGPLAEHTVMQFAFTKVFVSGTAVDLDAGLMDNSPDEVHMKQLMLRNSKERYLLADSSKMMHRGLIKVSPLFEFDAVITDNRIDPEVEHAMRKANVPLVIAGRGAREAPW